MINDDIAAISTPPGEGGIAIVRLSGPGVIDKVHQIFEPFRNQVNLCQRPSFSLTLGWIMDETGEAIDEVLVGLMRSPRSYTGENVVEINCHGGLLPARRVLERVMEMEVRLAEPGEFTRRAFLNGRMDAMQAEAIIDIIRAKSDKSMRLAMKSLSGSNSRLILQLEDNIIHVNALLEASIDFPDEVGDPDYSEIRSLLKGIVKDIDNLIRASDRAEIYRTGISVAITGKPNVGKSSLLNALLRKEKAIVTNIPGTTRDLIEDYIHIKGIPVKIIDTAGIRITDDLIEKIGVERSWEVVREADLVMFLLDNESGITDEDMDIYQYIDNSKAIVLVNKDDLAEKNITEEQIKAVFKGVPIIRISVKEDIGLGELEDTIENMVVSGEVGSDDLEIMLNMRHKKALQTARKHTKDALAVLEEVPLDCLGVDIQGALEALGQITGKNLKAEVLERIFHDFCIGK